MAYDYKKWKARMDDRQDLSSSLDHPTKSAEIDRKQYSVVDILLKILREKKIFCSRTEKEFIRGKSSAVCFQDAPLHSIAQNLNFEKKLISELHIRRRYSGFGIVISKYYLFQNDCRPIIYDRPGEGKQYIAESDFYRVSFDITKTSYIIDLSHEREWRLPGNF
jgi:hypothetical protein